MKFLLSFLLGLLPETLYFTLFLINVKDLKEKKIRLFFLIGISYCLCIMVQNFKILFYILWVALTYLALKLLYKKKIQIIDIFIISLSYFWVALLSFILMNFVNKDFSNYFLILFIQKILLFVPIIFKNKFNVIYKKYYKLWNRNDKEKRPIKSLTLRNMSLILLNSFIFFMNILLMNIINFQK